jgi:outer membrane protein W
MALVLAAGHATASSALAQPEQSVTFSIGYFVVRGEDARVEHDVLVYNRATLFRFDLDDFNTGSLGAEYLVALGDYLEAGAGLGWSSRAVDTVYTDFSRRDGSEIEQQLKLRIVPITATLRVLPLGRRSAVQPYVGGGIGLYRWRYSETGDFIDFSVPGQPIFRDSYSNSGTAVGPVAVFGARVPIGQATLGGEIRYQQASGALDTADFLDSRIDLGGLHYAATIGVRW